MRLRDTLAVGSGLSVPDERVSDGSYDVVMVHDRLVNECAIDSNCSWLVDNSSNLVRKECEALGLGHWKCEISCGRVKTFCGSPHTNLAPPNPCARRAVGILAGPRRTTYRMGVTGRVRNPLQT